MPPVGLFTITLHRRAIRFLRKNPHFAKDYEAVAARLVQQPFNGSRHIKHLKGEYDCSRRWAVGEYRILYTVHKVEREVVVFDIDHRQSIYG